jgi:hypothetical protein
MTSSGQERSWKENFTFYASSNSLDREDEAKEVPLSRQKLLH